MKGRRMKPEVALALQDRINREAQGLQKMVEQLSMPDAAGTMAGLKSGLTILARSLHRTNQVLYDIVRAEVESPASRNPFSRLFQ